MRVTPALAGLSSRFPEIVMRFPEWRTCNRHGGGVKSFLMDQFDADAAVLENGDHCYILLGSRQRAIRAITALHANRCNVIIDRETWRENSGLSNIISSAPIQAWKT